MAEVASAFVSIMPSAKGFGSKLDRQVSPEVNKTGKRLGSGFGKIFAGVAAIGIGKLGADFLKGAIDQASGLEEAGTKLNAIFGDKGSAAVQKFADAGAKALGQNRLAVLDSAATFGTMGKAAGLSGTKLAEFSTGFATLSTDLASFNNSSPEEATEALGAALRGEAEPIRRFGVLLDDATLKSEAMKLGLIDTTKEALTPANKVLAAQAAIYKQTKDAQGDFVKTSGGLANQQRILSAQWTDMKGRVGKALLPVVTNFVSYMNDNLIPVLSGAAEYVRDFKDKVVDFYKRLSKNETAIAAFEAIRDTAGDLRDGLGKAVDNAKKIGGALGKIDLAKLDAGDLGEKLGAAVAIALDKIVSLAGTVGAKLGAMFGKIDWVGLGITIGKYVPALLVGLAAGILNFDLGSLLKGIGDHWLDILLGVLAIAFAPAKFAGALAKILGKIPFVGSFLARAVTWVNQLGGKLTKFGGDLLKQFWAGFTKSAVPGAAFVTRILGLLKSAPGKIKGFFATLQTRIGVWALDAFEAMGKGARTAIGGTLRFVGGIPGKIISAIGSLSRLLFPKGTETIAGLLSGLRSVIGKVIEFHRAIPERLLTALGDLGSLFYNKGVELIAGLARGITAKMTDAINAVKSGLSRIKGLLPGSPIKWGPLKNWNNGGAGKRLMDLVARGITAATPRTVKAAQSAFEKIGDSLEAQRDKLRGTLDSLKGDFASLADSVVSAFTGDLFGVTAIAADTEAGVAGRTVGQAFVDNLLAKKGELSGLLASFKTLQGWGIDPSFLSQLFASGNGALITELAGMGQAGAVGAANLFGEVTSLGKELGGAVAANDPVAKAIEENGKELREVNRQLSFLAEDIGKQLDGAAAKAHRTKKGKGKK